MSEKTVKNVNAVREFYRLVADEYHGLRDARGKVPMEYQDLFCPHCGKVTSHRVEFGKRLEKRHCTECRIGRNYAL
jgi:hypothetical protein